MRGLARCRDYTGRSWLHHDQEHHEAARHHDERDHAQDVFHEDSDRIFCFAVTSVSQLPSSNLPTLALIDAYRRPSLIKRRELRGIATKEKAIRVCRMRQDQWTAGISQPLEYDLIDPRMQPWKADAGV
jgi:hypothetical protein